MTCPSEGGFVRYTRVGNFIVGNREKENKLFFFGSTLPSYRAHSILKIIFRQPLAQSAKRMMQPSLLLGRDTHRELADLLQKEGDLTVSGASSETAKAILLSHILGFHAPRRVLLVTENAAGVDGLSHWIHFFGQTSHVLVHPNAEGATVACLQDFSLLLGPKFSAKKAESSSIFLLDRAAFDLEFPSYPAMAKRQVTLKEGEEAPFTQLVESLLGLGYSHGEDLVLAPGEYRRIGDTLDIYPVQADAPYRVSFDFDVVRSIVKVDTEDMSKTHPAGPTLAVLPARWSEESHITHQLPPDVLVVFDDQDDLEPLPKNHTLSFTAFPGVVVTTHICGIFLSSSFTHLRIS